MLQQLDYRNARDEGVALSDGRASETLAASR
jgi:hypothetical protein